MAGQEWAETLARSAGREPSDLVNYLTGCAGVSRTLPRAATLVYSSAYELILRHGTYSRGPLRLPAGVRQGERKECFANATRLALSGGGMTYCEGYATGVLIPVQHAWCVRADGTVVDPTWSGRLDRPADSEVEYAGVRVARELLAEIALRTGVYGMLEVPVVYVRGLAFDARGVAVGFADASETE